MAVFARVEVLKGFHWHFWVSVLFQIRKFAIIIQNTSAYLSTKCFNVHTNI